MLDTLGGLRQIMQKKFATGVLPACFVSVVLLLAGCVHSPPSQPWDPIQPANRVIFKFNRKADQYVLRPVAKGYNKITPDPVQSSVGNFFANAHEPVTIINSILQLNFKTFNQSLGRFMINTVAGVGGLFDVATKVGVPNPQKDFGQTLGRWGLGRGPYLVLPLLGPSDGRDLVGRAGDHWLYPVTYLGYGNNNEQYTEYGLSGLYFLNKRAQYLGYEQMLSHQFDPYIFLRSYYLKQRQQKVDNARAGQSVKNPSDKNNKLPVGR